jgi:hypothetical protein
MVSPRTQYTRGRLLAAFAVVGIVAAMLLAVTPTSTDAAQFDVTVTDDTGPGSLRQAVADAAATAGDDDVVVTPGLGTITLASEILYGAAADGAVTIQGNGATVASSGGLVLNNQSNFAMTIDGFTVTRSPAGGNLLNTGDPPLTVLNTTVSGGGMNTGNGTLTVTNSTVTGSTGHGINTGNGTLNVTGTTITGNAEEGINTGNGPVTIVNSTITGNSGEGVTAGSGSVTLVYSTVTANTAVGGAANVDVASFQSFASVLAQPQGGPNCGEPGTSNGFNFSDDASCGFTQSTDRENAGDPGLGALADNGGSTQTRLPQAASPLIDAIPAESCQADGASGVTTDQRGVVRPQGGGCDIGSVEVEVAAPPSAPPPVPAAAVPVPAVARFTG